MPKDQERTEDAEAGCANGREPFQSLLKVPQLHTARESSENWTHAHFIPESQPALEHNTNPPSDSIQTVPEVSSIVQFSL